MENDTCLSAFRLRRIFYLVTPSESTYHSVQSVPPLTLESLPWFIVLICLEYVLAQLQTRGNAKYALNDSVTSAFTAHLSFLWGLVTKGTMLAVYAAIYDRCRLVDLPAGSPWVWLLAFASQDLAYYWAHRATHEIAILWAFHQHHHSSEYYNLLVGNRQSVVQDFAYETLALWQAAFIPPHVWITHRGLNGLYNFWLHTQLVPPLGPVEYVLNTPSLHRVHHGRNPYCIDKNFAGVMSVYDVIFGTLELEKADETICYGLVEPMGTFNQLHLQFCDFATFLWTKPRSVRNVGDKIRAVFYPPGWFPGTQLKWFMWYGMADKTEGIPQIAGTEQPYNPPLETWLKAYISVHSVLAFTVAWFHFPQMASSYTVLWPHLLWNVWTAQTFGAFFDKRQLAPLMELLRIVTALLYLLLVNGWFTTNSMAFGLIMTISALLWMYTHVMPVSKPI